MASIRYYLDEHIAEAVAKGLRRRGVDVLSLKRECWERATKNILHLRGRRSESL